VKLHAPCLDLRQVENVVDQRKKVPARPLHTSERRQPPEITLAVLMRPFAVAWTEQRKTLIGCLPRSLAYLDAVA
jgi:hypothetical protein